MTAPQGDAADFSQEMNALHQATEKTRWINQQVSEGKLRLNPEAAEAAAKVCEQSAAKVRAERTRLHSAGSVKGLGDYPTAQGLTDHFEQKAMNEDAGALALLQKMQEALLDEADAYRNAAKDYRVTDEQIADDFRRDQQ